MSVSTVRGGIPSKQILLKEGHLENRAQGNSLN